MVLFWIYLKVQLVRQIDRLGVGEDEQERGVWDNSWISGFSDWVSDEAIRQDAEHGRRSRMYGERS